MSTVVKDLGAVSAYAYAVEKGYTGTEAEFAELMADYAEVGQRAEDAANSALESKTAAQTAATTATNKASEAATSAQTATTKAGEASQSASNANTAKEEAAMAKTAAETAQGKAEDAQAAAERVAESIPSDYSQLSEDVSDLKEGFTKLTTATADDVGKALKAKTVTDGKVTEWEFGTGSDDSAEQYASLIYGGNIKLIRIDGWIEKEYIKTDDGQIGNHDSYHRTDYIEVSPDIPIKFHSIGNYETKYNAWYDENKEFISSFSTVRNAYVTLTPPENAKYMRLSFRVESTNTIETVLKATVLENNALLNTDKTASLFFRTMPKIGWQHTGSGNYNDKNNRRATTNKTISYETDIAISSGNGYSYALQYFDSDAEPAAEHFQSSTGWLSDSTIVPAGQYFRITYKSNDEHALTLEDLVYLNISKMSLNDVIKDAQIGFDGSRYASIAEAIRGGDKKIYDMFVPSESDDYVVGSDFIKRKVTVEKLTGVLSYPQSFCIYENKYYSTNGSKIAEQDENFNVIRDVDVRAGHGNSFQLGHDGLAYISGWDDGKLYIVDFATLTVTNEIALPVEGYTTCAVDDINKIAYIFHRTTYPSTKSPYDFIAYDYDNSQIIYQSKTPSFAAMQACDFCEGRIFVANGTGASEAPTEFRIYNTHGDVVANYVLNTLAKTEPEGVFIDRLSYDIYISNIGKTMYKISV